MYIQTWSSSRVNVRFKTKQDTTTQILTMFLFQVDTHVHAASCMNQKHLLRFIKKKIKSFGNEEVCYKDKSKQKLMTLKEVCRLYFTMIPCVFFMWDGREEWINGRRKSCCVLSWFWTWHPLLSSHGFYWCKHWRLGGDSVTAIHAYTRIYTMTYINVSCPMFPYKGADLSIHRCWFE